MAVVATLNNMLRDANRGDSFRLAMVDHPCYVIFKSSATMQQ